MSFSAARDRYPSDLNDRQWARVSPLLPKASPLGCRRRAELKDVVDALNYRWSTGCAWRMLPHDFPPWTTVYTYFRRWRRMGLLHQIQQAVISRDDQARGRRHQAVSPSGAPNWPVEGRSDPHSTGAAAVSNQDSGAVS